MKILKIVIFAGINLLATMAFAMGGGGGSGPPGLSLEDIILLMQERGSAFPLEYSPSSQDSEFSYDASYLAIQNGKLYRVDPEYITGGDLDDTWAFDNRNVIQFVDSTSLDYMLNNAAAWEIDVSQIQSDESLYVIAPISE